MELEVKLRIQKEYGDTDDFDIANYDWRDYLVISDYKEIINKYFTYQDFSDTFAIDLGSGFKTKKEKLAWMLLLVEPKNKNGSSLTRSDINRLEIINIHLSKFVSGKNV